MWLRRWEWSYSHSLDSPFLQNATDVNQLSVVCGQRFKIMLDVKLCIDLFSWRHQLCCYPVSFCLSCRLNLVILLPYYPSNRFDGLRVEVIIDAR